MFNRFLKKPSQFRINWLNVVHHVALFIMVLLFLLPLFWIVVTSLRPIGAPPPSGIEWWVSDVQWSNYQLVFDEAPMARYVRNSLLVVAVAVPCTVLSASAAGFALAQLPDSIQRVIVYTSMGLLIVPAASVWIFRFQIFRWLGVLDSLWALILPSIAGTNPLYILIYYWTYRRIPSEMLEAAQLDGASAFTSWWWIARPLAKPTTAAVIVLSAVFYWSDFVSPVLYLYQTKWYTLPIGLQLLKQLDLTNWPLLMAGATIMTMPIVLLFLILQRLFLSDLSLGNT